MIFIALLGLIAIIFSIFYLAFHFIKKIKDRERRLSKKIFYPSFVGGIIAIILGLILYDSTFEAKLSHALKENEVLIADKETLQLENKDLGKKISDLESDKEETNLKLTEYESNIESLEEEKAEFNTEKDSLNEELTDLTEANTNLEDELASLESQLESTEATLASAESKLEFTESKLASAGSNTQSPSSSSSTSSNSNSEQSSSETSVASSNVYFENCTAARNAGAAPVRTGDPGYAKHLDRDGDGIGCE